MSNAQPPPLPPPTRAGHAARHAWAKIGAFLLMLAPAPAGLFLMMANEDVGEHLYNNPDPAQPGFYPAAGFALIAVLCCLFGGIKLFDGFAKGGWRIIAGTMLGLT